MDQLKFSLGPFELFSSILAGAPLLLAGFLLYRPVAGMRELLAILKDSSSFSIAVAVVLSCYLIGALTQGVSWRYFRFVAKAFRIDYGDSGRRALKKMGELQPEQSAAAIESQEFEDRLAALLHKKFGAIKQLNVLDSRLISYVRLHSLPTAAVAESYLAQHIMFRALSFGFLLLAPVLTATAFRTPNFTKEEILLPCVSLLLSVAAFQRAISFRRWRYRELLHTFYHLASGEQQKTS
jgi:hypothetical protein